MTIGSKTYNEHEHTAVAVTHFEDGVAFDIVLKVRGRTWITATYNHPGGDCVQVGDGLTNGFTEDGGCIVSVPDERCTFLTPVEASGLVDEYEAYLAADFGHDGSTRGPRNEPR